MRISDWSSDVCSSDLCRRAAPAPHGAQAQVQDSGRHPPSPGAARPGREGRARQQRRGADHLSLARGPLLRADAQHHPWRGHVAHDLQPGRSQAAEADTDRSATDPKSVVQGKSVSVRVELGGSRSIKKIKYKLTSSTRKYMQYIELKRK